KRSASVFKKMSARQGTAKTHLPRRSATSRNSADAGVFQLPCMLVCIFVSANRTRDRGCSKHPIFPAPSKFRRANEDANLGRSASRDRSLIFNRSLTFSRHHPRKRMIQMLWGEAAAR